MKTNMVAMRRTIMRRVYTIFTARLVSSPVTLNLALFGVALVVFAQMVHVARIIEGLFSTSLAHLPTYILNAVMRGEVVTLAAIGVMIFSALSIQWRLRSLWNPKLKLQSL